MGAIIFLCIYGFHVVNPTYDDFILQKGGDSAQHYIGWQFYRNSPWHFPIGLIDGLSADKPTSCMYTDSIPLFAIFFKLLSPILPETFQYTGLWELFSFAMMGGTSAVLLHRFHKSTVFCVLGSVFFVVSPTVLQRTFGHEALSGQWVLVMALLFWVYQDHKWKHRGTPVILWAVLGSIAVLVHIYFIPMVYAVLLGYLLTDILRNRKIVRPLASFLAITVSSLCTMFLIGGFYGAQGVQAPGLGKYSANYNALWNPFQCSHFLKALHTNKGQSEGLGYLGLGVILAGMILLVLLFSFLEKRIHNWHDCKKWVTAWYPVVIPVCVVMIISAFMAASPVGTLNARILYTIPYPEKIMEILSIFRASGRFIWIDHYIIDIAVFAGIAKLNQKKTVIFMTAFCLCLQLLDFRDFFVERHQLFTESKTYQFALDDEAYEEITAGVKEIVFLPLPVPVTSQVTMYVEFGEYAARHDMTLRSFYTARVDYEMLSADADREYAKLKQGGGSEEMLYVFTEETEIPVSNPNLQIYEVAGYTIGRYREK